MTYKWHTDVGRDKLFTPPHYDPSRNNTDQSVPNKVSNFLGGDNIQNDITLTVSGFTDSTPLTVIDTNLEASNDTSRVDYFACENGSNGEVLTTTVGKVALSVKKAGGTLSLKRTNSGHGCQLELPATPTEAVRKAMFYCLIAVLVTKY